MSSNCSSTMSDILEAGRDAQFSEALLHQDMLQPDASSSNVSALEQPHVGSDMQCPQNIPAQSQIGQSLDALCTAAAGGKYDKRLIPREATEQSPLLGHHATSSVSPAPAIQGDDTLVTWQHEARIIATYSAPLILTFLLQYSITVTSVFVVGRLGQIELGAVSLANMSAAITCLTPFQGLATSLDTLCSQAFGSGYHHLVGVHCQRLTLFLLCLSVPVAVLWIFSESMFLRIVPDPRSAALAGLYLKFMAFGIPGIVFFETGKRFLQAQCLFRATTYILLIAAPVNVFLHWLLVWRLGLGYVGAPIAAALTTNLIPVLLLFYVIFINGSKCWGGLSRRALQNWSPMLRFALPSMIMVEVEWLAFELMTFLASRFGTDYLAAQSILGTLTSISYQIPFPLSIAASTRVAHLIGAGDVKAAKKTAKVAFGATCTVVLANLTIYAVLRYQLPLLFTNDKRVIELAAAYLPLVALVQFFDGISSGAHGLLRGIGKQHIGGPVNLIAYYIIALPIVLGLVFGLGWKLDGMWTGIAVGLICVSLFEYTYLINVNWQKAADEAAMRNAAG